MNLTSTMLANEFSLLDCSGKVHSVVFAVVVFAPLLDVLLFSKSL